MAHKFVNLDDLKSKITITIGKKDFEIARLVISVIKEYGAYVQFVAHSMQKLSKVQDLENMNKKELEKLNQSLGMSFDSFINRKIQYLEKILEGILQNNGYEFDKDWWYENADYSDIEAFIHAVMQKDETDGVKKNGSQT